MTSKITFRSEHVSAFLAALFVATSVQATPEVLDWDANTWLPDGNTNLSETFTTGSGDITFTFSGNTAGLDQAGPDISPAVNQLNTGGLVPAQNGLYVATDYVDNSNPMVMITIDFTGYPGGVGNVSFDVFDNDNGGTFIDEMTITAVTATGTIDPTSIVTSVSNSQVNSNTVVGTAGSAASSSDANITWIFGDAGTPVSGITQINIIWRNTIGTADPGFQWINIHDIFFDDPMADVEVSKGVAPASAGAGESVVFTIDVVNNGPDDAPGVEITDQLPAGYTYLSDNSGGNYNSGTGVWTVGTLAPAGTAQLQITARMEDTGPWENIAEATQILATDTDSTPGNNVPAEDDQDNASVTLLVPEIGAAKAITAGPTNNGDGTYTLTYTTTVVNSGDTVLNSVQIVDDLDTTFAAASAYVVDSVTSADFAVNAGFDGSGDTDLLAGTDTLPVAGSGTVALTVTVTPGGTPGPYNNTATADGLSPGSVAVNDDSTDGANPDPDGDGNPGNNFVPTPVTFSENPEIGAAKRVVATPVNNGDGTRTLTYEINVVNSGDVVLNGVQVVDDMAATFAASDGVVVDSVTSGDFTVNPGYDGNGSNNVLTGADTLAAGASGTVSITVTVTVGAVLGTFNNTAVASGTSPGATGVNDDSQTGSDPDPDGDGNPGNNSIPTPISFTESPQIGLAKAVTAGPTNNGDGTHTLTYSFNIENFGDGVLNSVQVVDNLATTFSGATGFVVDSVVSGDFTVNAGFNGAGDTNVLAGTDSLAIGATGTVDVTVTVTPGGTLGPYDNSSFARGQSPTGSLSIDNSVDGLDPDPDGNGDPVDNVGPTPVTFGENPEIGTAKAISAGPTNNGDGTYTLTYSVTVENSGDVPLNSVQVVDDLATTFAAATGFVVDSVTSADFAVNAGFNGAADTNLLAGTDTLATGASGTVDVTVTVTPGGTLGPYNNSATADGTSPAATVVNDVSQTGVNPDPDGDGNPGNNSAPTPVTFGENPEIGTAKAISAGPTNNGDGTYTLTYSVTVENSGDVPLNSVQVVDDLATTFAAATGFVVDSVTSADFAVNAGFNGAADTNLLAGTDTLATGASGTVDVTVTVTPGGTLGPYNNSATADGTSPAATVVNDVSQTGVNPDPDGDGNPGNNSAPTPVTFGENPEIGTAKVINAGPTNNGDGTYTLTYSVTVENSGDVPLSSVQVVDDLSTTFAGATGFVVDSVTSADFAVNAGFNGAADTNLLAGTDTLATGASGTVDVTVTVTPGATLGPYDNSATGSGTSPAATVVNDVSQTGVNPDPDGDGNPGNNSAPTPVTFGENPEIGTAKVINAGPTNNGDGTYTLTYSVTVENSGDVPLNSVQVVDDLATTFAAATGFVVDSVTSADFAVNAGFNGAADTNVLAGTDTLATGASGTVDVTVTVTPGATLGPYDNSATGSGTSPAATVVNDVSQTGVNPDPDGDGNPGNNSAPTPVTFGENPEIGTAKAISAGPTNNGDGTYTLTYSVTVENSGDVPLNSVQVVDDLATTFAAATGFVVDSVTSADFAVNAGFNGAADTNLLAGTDTLATGASGTVDVTVTVTPGGTLGPYNNSATADGTSPAATVVNDVSQTGVNPDPDGDGNPGNNSAPTPVTFGENPEIGTAKVINAGPTNNGDGTYTLTYSVTVENSGDVPLSSVQVVDDLSTTFAGATGFVVDSVTSADFAVNAGFNGAADTNLLAGTDTLATGASGTVDVTVTVTPGATLGPYDNSATGSGTSPAATVVNDVSQTGVNPDPDGDGNPGNNSAPTPVTFSESPEIGTAKSVNIPTNNGDGTFTLTYTVIVENSGDVALNNVQVVDNLATTFAAATGFVVDSVTSADFAVNAGFNGAADTNLLAGADSLANGASGTIAIQVTVTPGGALGPYDNTATADGVSPVGTGVSDDSTTGADPDPDGDGDPGNNSTPTPVSFDESPQIGVAKAITAGPINNGDGSHTLTYTMTLENFGDVVLNSVQVTENLAGTFAGATGFVVDSLTSGDFTVNAGYNGAADTNVLDGTDTLAVGATGSITLTVTVTPGGTLGPYDNTVAAQGLSPGGSLTLDNSVDGLDPDPDGNNDPVDNTSPTPVTFGENPEIGTAKTISAGPTNNGDGTQTLTYSVTVANSGDVPLNNLQVVDDLAITFAAATGFVVDSVTSADFAVNAGYNGAADTNVLAGTDTLAIGASGTVEVTVTVTPGGTLGPYNNSATGSGSSPAGTGVNDVSNTGVDPDPDGDGNPGNNSAPTPVTFGENPEIGTAKSVSAGPTNNGDGTYTLTYSVAVENSGDVPLNNVQVVDDLATTFAGATGFVVDSVTSADFTANAGFNGAADTNVLAGTDTLAIGATGTVDVTVTVTPGGTLGPYDNTATADGSSPAGTGVSDVSTTGADPDPDGDGNPGNNSAPTPVTFSESPEIGTAKSANAPTNNGDGTFTLTYTVIVENSGDVTLSNVQVVDDLATTFAGATAFVVDSVTSADFAVNAGYNGASDTNLLGGADSLANGMSGTISVQVTVTPGGLLGPYSNTATADGVSPVGTGVSDDSTTGADPDPDGDGDPGNNSTPTPVSFDESPQIGVAKAITAGPTNNGDGTHTLTYTFTLENFGDVVLDNVQATDNLATTFAAATGFVVDSLTSTDFTVNAGFDGNGNNDTLAGTDSLAVGATGTIELTVTVTPGGTLGPYDNAVFAQGFSPGGSLTLDNSVDGLDPDPDGNNDPVDNVGPTPVTFGENPEIGTAKAVSAGPASNGDGTHTLTYRITVENSGDVALNNVQVIDDLAATFAGATGFVVDSVTSTDFAVNAGFDGTGATNVLAGTDTLAIGASGTIDVVVSVTPGATLGPYNNSASGSGDSPAGTGVNDVSNTGVDPDPDGDGDPGNNSAPTLVTFGENPIIGAAKTSTAATNNGDGTFTLTYTVIVENSGDVDLNSVQVVDDLAATYAGATGFVVDSVTSTDFSVNAGYNGAADTSLLAGTDTLAIGAAGTISVQVTVTPGGLLGPYNNTATASGSSPAGTGVSDDSNTGVDPDPDGDGDPGNNSTPTPVSFDESPQIGVAKAITAGPTNNGDGTYTLSYTFTLENFGDVVLSSVQAVENLAGTFAAATGFTVDDLTSPDFAVNAGFNGDADRNLFDGTDSLLVGATGTAILTVTVTPGATLGPYDNTVFGQGFSPGGSLTLDNSVDSLDPDPDGNGDPVDNVGPTPVTFGENPEIGAAKSAGTVTNNGDATFTLTYTIGVENSGDVALNNVQVVDDLSATFAGAAGFAVDALVSGDFSANAGFDGAADTNLLNGTDSLAVGASGVVTVTVTVTPGANPGPYNNAAVASGESGAGTPVSDISTDGVDPDPGSDGPGDDMTPTPVSFGLESALEGNAWLDLNIDDLFDSGEPPLEGWIIEVVQGGVVIASAPVNPDGSYAVSDLTPGAGYTIQLRHPSSAAVFGKIDDLVLPPGLTIVDQNLPIDPSGVVYDSDSRQPLTGVTVSLVDNSGTPLPASCLLPGQQDQVTGVDGLYRFDVVLGADPACASGDVFDIVFTAPAGYVAGTSAVIPPAAGPLSATGLPDPFQVQPQGGPPTGGASTLYYLSFLLSSGDPNIINNHIPIDPVGPPSNLLVSKRADRRQTVIGDLIVYTISVRNPGSAVNGLTLSDMIPAGFTYVPGSARVQPAGTVTATGQRPVLFSGISVAAGSTTELRYMLRVGAGVVQGDYVNTATPLVGGVPVGNNATATVTVTADPDFEQTSIVGMVFNDLDRDGWQDEGEHGIPGVRLATVEGLIIETDAFGRYHIAGVEGGRRDRGRNFIVKVDSNSLPDGVEFTTENPRVQRITEGLLNRFDFGVNMPGVCCEQIDVKIGEVFFEQGSSAIRPEFMPLMQQLAQRLTEHKGGTLFIEGHAEPSEAVAYTPAAYTVTQHFDVRSTRLRPADKAELDRIIERWRGVDNISVSAIGHTCNTPIAPKNRHEFKDNYALSVARAQAVASYVRLGLGISPEQVAVAGKGPDEPVASNATPEGGALNRRVELSVSGQRSERASSAADLARDRANSIYEALRKLLGDDLLRNISITSDTRSTGESHSAVPGRDKQESEMTSKANSGWLSPGLSRTAAAVLGLLVGTAHAGDLPASCTIDSCLTEEGYAIQILPSSDLPSPNDTRAALADDKRVDISGRFSVPVFGGGRLWATEDPAVAEPRLAAHGPRVTPVENGSLAMPVSFYVYANYPAFIEKAEIQIYYGGDVDLIDPIATVPFRPGVYSRIDWNGADLSRRLRPNEELYFRVRAYDADGHYDETHLDHFRLVTLDEYKRSAESDPTLLMPNDYGLQSNSVSSRGPLDGNVLVLQPPARSMEMDRSSYNVTSHFDTRKTVLKAQDRAEIDRIIAEWQGGEQLRLHVIGHTDSIRIAPEHRNEFANNQVLSEARARVVAQYIAGQLGLQSAQVFSEGRAATEPVATNASSAGRAKNRRVEVTIKGLRPSNTVARAAGKTLVEPHSNTSINITQTLEEALNLIGARTGEKEATSNTGKRYAETGSAQTSAHALKAIYGKSHLRVQRIPVNGSRVRINGQGLGGHLALRINGEPVPLDKTGKYTVEYVMPVGNHDFDVELVDDRGNVTDRSRLPVEVSGKHIFMVALADLTVSDNSVSGSIEPTSGDDRYDDDVLVEGRLAFYLKGKVKGKYLITAQMDSQEEELGDLFGNLLDKDPKSVLRRLDPDRYYPVYGDDSTTINDTDSQGRLYVRADWDKSRAVWGNFHTGLTGNEFAQYNRSLYGAQYLHQSLKITGKGEAKTEAIAFVSEAQTAFGHSEFLGTGGSLYYLKHQDILPGSEKAWIEVRDRDSDRVRDLVTLTRGLDYEVDEIQGRIILARPLMQVSGLHAPGLIKDTPLDGDDLVLLVDYEYVPLGFDANKAILGGSAKHWLTDNFAIGATVVDENRNGEDYNLLGGDVLWQPGEGTYVKAEFAQSEASQADRFLSADGGLTFDAAGPMAPGRAGDAWSVEARMNSREALDTENEWVGGAWYRRTDDNFSVARRDPGVDTTEYGIEMTGSLSERMNLSVRASVVERELVDEDRRLSLQVDYGLTDDSSVSAEVRNVDEKNAATDATGLLLALRYSRNLNQAVEVYGIGQATLSNDSGRYDNNDMATVGITLKMTDRTSLQGEYSSGHRGNGAILSAEHRLDERHEVYGTFTQSVDRTDLLEPGTKMAVGHRSRITDQVSVFNERQFVEDRGQAGIAHVFGLDFGLESGWAFGLSMQNGELDTAQGTIDRDAATVTANFRGQRVNWRGKVEYRNENGASDVRQTLTTNRFDLKLSQDWRLLARLNHAETEDATLSDRDDSALFTEAGVGFAYRPVANNRLNLLAKYTFLYDLPAVQQIDGGTDQRSHIMSLEGIYRLNPKWELGGKLAQRSGELRTDRDYGQWFESTTNFAALRARYHLIRRWDALLELRRLDVDEAQSTRTGWLFGVDRHLNDNFRVGVGYNFTDFSDDLSNLDYDHKGWFLNALGKY